MRRLTASKVALAMHCLAFLRDDMPQDEEPPMRSRPGHQRKGLGAHAALEAHVRLGVVDWEAIRQQWALAPAMLRDAQAFADNAIAWLEAESDERYVIRSLRAAEVSYAIGGDPVTAVQLEETGTPRNYSAAPNGWIGATLDVLLQTQRGVVWIVEMKTGRSGLDHPRDHIQLKTQAVAVSRARHLPVMGTVLRVSTESAIPVNAEPHLYSRLELDVHAEMLRQIAEDMAREEQGPAVPEAGDWCDAMWCPARGACPKYAGKRRVA